MQKVFFTSDLHFGHENVIRFDGRPFETVEEMNEELIKRWNNKVSPGDLVYVLGDFVWKAAANYLVDILKRLNGQIILIAGNHDTHIVKNGKAKKMFAAIKHYDDICVTLENGESRRCILSHYFMPLYNGHYYNAIHLHGHSHNTEEHNTELEIAQWLKEKGYKTQIYNVGCMHWNYEPVTLDEILGVENGTEVQLLRTDI